MKFLVFVFAAVICVSGNAWGQAGDISGKCTSEMLTCSVSGVCPNSPECKASPPTLPPGHGVLVIGGGGGGGGGASIIDLGGAYNCTPLPGPMNGVKCQMR